jgi:CheY-like chemotaxis protein
MLAEVPWLRVYTCCKPRDGLALALDLQPDLVLLDIHMPELDGYQVLARLRAHSATAHLPVVAVSADAMPSDLDMAQAAGFAAYLTKPLNFERLMRTVQQLSQPRQNPIAADL